MKLYRWHRVAIISLSLAAMAGGAADGPAEQPRPLDARLEVVGGAEVVAGDPVLVTMRVRNEGTEPVSFVPPQIRPPIETTVYFEVRSPRGRGFVRVTKPWIYVGSVPAYGGGQWPIKTLMPGEAAEFALKLDWSESERQLSERHRLFPDTGEYAVRAHFRVRNQPLPPGHHAAPRDEESVTWMATEAATVRVTLPENNLDVAAYQALLRLPEAWRFYAPWYSRRHFPDELAQFREHHRDSRYFKFTELAIASSRFWRAVGARDATDARAAHAECLALIAQAKDEPWPPGWLAVAVEFEEYLARTIDLDAWTRAWEAAEAEANGREEAPGAPDPKEAQAIAQQVAVLPAYEFMIGEKPMLIPVAIHNDTGQPLRYATHSAAFYGLRFRLTKDGEPIPAAHDSTIPPGPVDVRELPPGQVAVENFNLNSWYVTRPSPDAKGYLTPGTYILELGMEAGPRSFGVLRLGLTELNVPLRPAAVIVVKAKE